MDAMREWSVRNARGLYRIYRLCRHIAPSLARSTRWLGRQRMERWLAPLERLAKGFLFDCRMCGQCLLSATGMACPMRCGKQMRNGPCGGVGGDGSCEVNPAMTCVWVQAIAGEQRIHDGAPPLPPKLHPPLDHTRRGASTWIQVICDASSVMPPPPEPNPAVGLPGLFEQACRAGKPVVTVEVAPPDSPDPAALVARASHFRGLVDAINITDGAGGNCHMSSAAASAILVAHGFTPVYQVACRDRNRIAIQGDLVGAAALGVRNILCLTGDHVSRGDHPQAKPVFDLDAVSLLHIARNLRDRGEYASGRKLEAAPGLFLGATANPFVPPYHDRIANFASKVQAGAQFVQTQFCFDPQRLAAFMREVRVRELHRRCRIIVGVGTLASAKALRWMATHVPGIYLPEPVLARVAAAGDQQAEARRVCLEMIDAVMGIDGIAGVHLMGHRNEEALAQIIAESGLRQRAVLRSA